MGKGYIKLFIIVLVTIGVWAITADAQDAPTVKLIVKPQPENDILFAGGSPVAIIAKATGSGLQYTWEAMGPGEFEQKSNTVGTYTPPEYIESDDEMVIITLTVIDDQNRSASESIVLTIQKNFFLLEAEECDNIRGCNSEGWIFWDKPECSGKTCLANTNPQDPTQPVKADYSLPFRGKGIIVVYRKEVFYGSLRVEMDGAFINDLKQRGTSTDKAEMCYEADEEGEHTLKLSGAGDKIVTLDAFKILMPGQECLY